MRLDENTVRSSDAGTTRNVVDGRVRAIVLTPAELLRRRHFILSEWISISDTEKKTKLVN